MRKRRRPVKTETRPLLTLPVVPVATLMVVTVGYLAAYYLVLPQRGLYWLSFAMPDLLWVEYWTGGRGWPAILDRLPVWLLVLYYQGTAYAAGRLMLGVLRPTELPQLDKFVIANSLGLGLLSTLTLALGLAGGLQVPKLFWSVTLAIHVAHLYWSWQRADREGSGWARVSGGDPREPHARRTALMLFLYVLLGFQFLYLVAGTLPPRDFDVLEYHLQVPKEWFLNGRIDFLPHNVYGNMPLGAEMHALGCMQLWLGQDAWWHGAIAGKAIISLFAPLTAYAIYSAGIRWFTPGAGVLGAAIYLAFPWIAHVSFNGLVDGVLAHYVFLAVYVASIAGVDWRKQLLAGMCAGSAAACKYPGLVFASLPVLGILAYSVWTVSDRAARTRTLALSLGTALAGLAIFAGPWYVKNAALTGNPVYPLAARWLDGKTRTPEKIAQWNRAHQVPQDADGWRYSSTHLAAAARQVALTSEWLSPIAWPLVVIGIVATWRKQQTQTLLLVVAWIFAVWFLATHRIDRFWLPAVPLLCLLAGTAWDWSDARGYRRTLLVLAIFGLAGGTLMLIAPILINKTNLAYLSDFRFFTPLQDLRDDMKSSHKELKRLAGEHEAVLLVGDAEPFDLRPPAFYNTCFDDCQFELLTRDRTPQEIRAAFEERRIAYVLVDWAEIARYRSPGNYGFTDYVQPEVFQRLVDVGLLSLLSSDAEAGWELYRVMEGSTAKTMDDMDEQVTQ